MSSGTLPNHLAAKLAERSLHDGLRQLRPIGTGLDFCSNDYLGYAHDAELRKQIGLATQGLPHGSTSSRLVRGHHDHFSSTESLIAEFHGAAQALIFNSGYDANLGFWSCVPQRGDTVIYDAHIHASIRDGIRLSNARNMSFRHNDLNHLQERLGRATGTVFLAVESLYSMDGDYADLGQMAQICQQSGARLVVDEAHATGVIGPGGTGLVNHYRLQGQVFARVHTFGKALGVHGAAVLGSSQLKQYLINFARPLIYTTALAPSQVVAIGCAYQYLKDHPQHPTELHQRIDAWHAGDALPSPIRGVVTADAGLALRWCKSLVEKGFDVKAMRHPTVPKGTERIRICIHRFNTYDDIERLQLAIHQLRDDLP